ncbi:hypothetical protein [Nocardia asteroides]
MIWPRPWAAAPWWPRSLRVGVVIQGTAPEPVLPAARALLSVLRAKGAVHH